MYKLVGKNEVTQSSNDLQRPGRRRKTTPEEDADMVARHEANHFLSLRETVASLPRPISMCGHFKGNVVSRV